MVRNATRQGRRRQSIRLLGLRRINRPIRGLSPVVQVVCLPSWVFWPGRSFEKDNEACQTETQHTSTRAQTNITVRGMSPGILFVCLLWSFDREDHWSNATTCTRQDKRRQRNRLLGLRRTDLWMNRHRLFACWVWTEVHYKTENINNHYLQSTRGMMTPYVCFVM